MCYLICMEVATIKSRGRRLVACTYCGNQFERYVSHLLRPDGTPRKVFKCMNCRRAAPELRFWKKVAKNGSPKGCWLWTGCVNSSGYGHFCGFEGNQLAHRISWYLTCACKPIPKDYWVLHKFGCDDKLCVNPAHLYLCSSEEARKFTLRHYRGGNNHNAILNEESVREIRREYRRGNVKNLASKFNVSIGCIRSVWRGKSWKHVT
jgi:hypothetical protein